MLTRWVRQTVIGINQLETITDGVIEAAASTLVIGTDDKERQQNTAKKLRRPQASAAI
jgi:hypothetical protein